MFDQTPKEKTQIAILNLASPRYKGNFKFPIQRQILLDLYTSKFQKKNTKASPVKLRLNEVNAEPCRATNKSKSISARTSPRMLCPHCAKYKVKMVRDDRICDCIGTVTTRQAINRLSDQDITVLPKLTHYQANNNVCYYHVGDDHRPKLHSRTISSEETALEQMKILQLRPRSVKEKQTGVSPLKNYSGFGSADRRQSQGQTRNLSGLDTVEDKKLRIVQKSGQFFPNLNGRQCDSDDCEQQPEQKKIYLIYKGNNNKLLGDLMQRRPDWQEGNYYQPNLFQFIWKPVSTGLPFNRLLPYLMVPQILNHFEFHGEISSKDNMFQNLKTHCDELGEDVFDYVPVTFSIELFTQNAHVELLHFNNFFKMISSPAEEEKDKAKKSPKKSRFVPTSREYPTLPDSHFIGRNIWLIKPTCFNRGRGIQIFDKVETLENLIGEYKAAAIKKRKQKFEQPGAKQARFIIQKYIENPFLIHNRKFDIRIWVLVTHQLEVYMFQEGYLRTSAEEFELNNLDDVQVHLTNNAVQRFGDSYGRFEEGNQLSFAQFQEYLDSNKIDISFTNDYIPRIEQLITLTSQSIGSKINKNRRKFCFEIFGYDFIIDADKKLWLIEVNTNPCLDESSQLLKQLIPRMLDDALKLTIDSLYPNEEELPPLECSDPVLKLPEENLWKHVCSALYNK